MIVLKLINFLNLFFLKNTWHSKLRNKYRNLRLNKTKNPEVTNPFNVLRRKKPIKRKANAISNHCCRENDCQCLSCIQRRSQIELPEEYEADQIESTFEEPLPSSTMTANEELEPMTEVPVIPASLKGDVRSNLKKLFQEYPEVKSYKGVIISRKSTFSVK